MFVACELSASGPEVLLDSRVLGRNAQAQFRGQTRNGAGKRYKDENNQSCARDGGYWLHFAVAAGNSDSDFAADFSFARLHLSAG